ncbi:hypothetical protein PG993_005608 [Apiospora rasikravindrae]|uniref:Uncharacterized protein n=1 Tax=Apiospora rasikravindrae TaxID=990691 RepID=A0ABR1TG41_9PEZI
MIRVLRDMMASRGPNPNNNSESSEDSYPDMTEESFEFLSTEDASSESDYLEEEVATPSSSSVCDEEEEEEELPVEDAEERVPVLDEPTLGSIPSGPDYSTDPWDQEQEQEQEQEQKEEKEKDNGYRVVAAGGAFYDEFRGPYKIRLAFKPDPNASSFSSSELPNSGWWAEIFIKCDSVPELMKQGLHWTAEKVVPEQGRMVFNPPPRRPQVVPPIPGPAGGRQPRARGPKTRHYYLQSLPDQPRWRANLQCHSARPAVLSRFRPGALTRDGNLASALAYATDGALVYAWFRRSPREAFNALYDDMPMKGWWPWPKAKAVPMPMPMHRADKEKREDLAATLDRIFKKTAILLVALVLFEMTTVIAYDLWLANADLF